MLKAIRNNQLVSFPGLTYELISKHLPPSSATDKGHMVRTRQGACSTRSNQKDILDARQSLDDMHPKEQICNASEDEMSCFAILADSNDATIYSDLAGRFPVQSYSGTNYIFVAYVYSINAILMRPRSKTCTKPWRHEACIQSYTCSTMNAQKPCKIMCDQKARKPSWLSPTTIVSMLQSQQ